MAKKFTNRDKFNQYVRDRLDEQCRAWERMSNREFADYIHDVKDSHVEVELGMELMMFRYKELNSMPGCDRDTLVKWLGEKARE